MNLFAEFSKNVLLWLVAIPLASGPFIYLVGRICVRNAHQPQQCAAVIPARWLSLAVLLFTWVPLLIAGQAVWHGATPQAQIGDVLLRLDGIGLLLATTALLLGTLVILFSMPYMAGDEGEEKYYALMPMMVATIIGLGCTTDLFNLWVWFETMAVCSYLLVAFYIHQRGALEAGIKYLVQSAVGSVLVLIAIAIVFSQTGTLQLDEIAAWGGKVNSILLAAGALFVVGFGVKTALVPLHTWLPDAHSQAPSGISAMLSGVVIEAGLVAMLRTLGNLPGGLPAWGNLLLLFGAVNMLVGNLMALRQTQVKRMLAYSSLSHMGYMLLGFGAAALFHTPDAAAGGFFHLFTHALMKGLAFLAVGVMLYTLHIAKNDHGPLLVDDLDGVSRRYPLAAFGLSVAVLALGGLPPLAGFMSKWQIFAGSAETRSPALIALVVFAALNSVLSLGYYAPLVNRMYRHEPSRVVTSGAQLTRGARWSMGAPLVLLIGFIVVLGFWPGLAQNLTAPAAQTLTNMFGGHGAVITLGFFGW